MNTERLATMLETEKPLVIDTMYGTWWRSVPGAVGLEFNFNTHGTFTDEVQERLEQKLRVLTGGDMAKPIVAMGFSVARFDGYNLALRIRHAGYTNLYWYRGGLMAWEVAGSTFGARQDLYERFHFGDATLRKAGGHLRFDYSHCLDMVRRVLTVPARDGQVFPQTASPGGARIQQVAHG